MPTFNTERQRYFRILNPHAVTRKPTAVIAGGQMPCIAANENMTTADITIKTMTKLSCAFLSIFFLGICYQ